MIIRGHFIKRLFLSFTLLIAPSLPSISQQKDNSLNLCNFAPEGMVAYAASYSSDVTNEPKYSTQNTKTFQYLNLGNTLDYYRGDSVKVGIIDSGINYDHEDFMVNNSTKVKGDSKYYTSQSGSWVYYGASSHGYNYIDDTLGHGTNVAATVAAAVNSIGGVGLAPNVELYVYKVTNSNNGYEFGAIQNALLDAKTLGLDVINMSFQSYEHAVSYGGSSMAASSGCSSVLSYYLNQAHNAGITLVGAAGNYNTNEPSYPGSNNYVINVGSLSSDGSDKAPFSNYGSTIDLVAPGYVYVADESSNSAYTNTQGTSFSAPLVTAAIALYIQKNPSATPAEIETALYASCDLIDDSGSSYTNWAGNGALNVSKFLDVAPATLNSISVSTAPTKTTYIEGNYFDPTGLVITRTYSDSSSDTYSYAGHTSEFTFTPSTSTALSTSNTSVTITYGGKSCSLPITVNNKTLESISISGQKTKFNINDTFSFGGTVTAHYDNGSSSNVTSLATFTGYDMSTHGTQTVTVSYGQKTAQYQITVRNVAAITDILTRETTGVSSGSSSYSTWSGKTVTTEAIYAGNSAGSYDSIQLRTSNSNSGIVSTNSGGTISKVTLDWNNNTSSGRTVDVYGSTKAYSSASDLYGNNKGTLLGSISYGSTELEIEGDYQYIGIKSSSGALYLNSVSFTWLAGVKSVDSIEIKTHPTRLSYDAGQYFDPTGLVITANYDDNTSSDIAYSEHAGDFTFTPSLSTALTVEHTSVTISYGGKSTSQAITVKALSSISISGYITQFVEGDSFSFGGTVKAIYSDSSEVDVTGSATITGYDMKVVGEQTITVSYSNKSATYQINVAKGTLSSISVSGQTTVYQKYAQFSFDGTCTATFANGYQKVVTPTSVSSPNMTTGGSKTITVSYTYNGKSVETTYQITVNSDRVVIEQQLQYSVVGTVSYTSGSEVISINTLTVSKGGYTIIENNSLRLGSGSNTGSLTINSSSSNIYKVVVNVKYYSGDSDATIKIGGTSYSLTSSYADCVREYDNATNSVKIETIANKKRCNISSATIYTKSLVDVNITDTSDCMGLETFINNNLHMDYTENLGYCSDSSHHYYATAKTAFNALNQHQRTLFTSNSAYLVEFQRLQAWASANGDTLNSSNLLVANKVNIGANIISAVNIETTLIIVVASITCLSLVLFFVLSKKRSDNK